MTRRGYLPRAPRSATIAALCAGLAAVALPLALFSEGPELKPGLYVGAPACATSNCHGSVEARHAYDVLQNEYFTWLQKGDRHYERPYKTLFGERSAAIVRNLHLSTPAAQTALCLDCHAMAVPKERQVNRLDIEDGISCETCHGPASGWLEGHRSEGWTHERSVAAGMVDLRDLGVRAALCLSCHQGAGDRGVDHDLIAAGHPQLAFELDNFSAAMPAHWMPFRDKRNKEGRRDSHGARAWAVGQAAALRAGAVQLARRARSPRWPEFSELSCESCHHSLAEQRWRTIRSSDRPGLPRWSPARWAALRQLLTVVAPQGAGELDAEVGDLARRAARLGTPAAEVAENAERVGRALEGVIAALDRAAWDEPQVKRVLLALADPGSLATADRATAEQTFFALHALTAHLLEHDPRLARSGLAAIVQSLERGFDDPYSWNPARFAEQLAQLRRQVERLP